MKGLVCTRALTHPQLGWVCGGAPCVRVMGLPGGAPSVSRCSTSESISGAPTYMGPGLEYSS